MNYRKIDASLASALRNTEGQEEEAAFSVFVRTNEDAGSEAAATLGDMGVRNPGSGPKVYSADLSPRAVAELSEKPWVKSLTLSRTLRPLRTP